MSLEIPHPTPRACTAAALLLPFVLALCGAFGGVATARQAPLPDAPAASAAAPAGAPTILATAATRAATPAATPSSPPTDAPAEDPADTPADPATGGAPAADAAADPTDPAAVADEAVRAWLAQEPLTMERLAAFGTPEELCLALPELLVTPPPQAGTEVNFDDRQERESGNPDAAAFTYSASVEGGQLSVVEVKLERAEGAWTATSVGYRSSEVGGRSWLRTPTAGVLFVIFSLLIGWLLLRPSFFRSWVTRGLATVRLHRRLVLLTMALLYGVFVLGVMTGAGLPDACGDAVLTLLNETLASVGAVQAIESGSVLQAAAVIFYQNFVVVTLTVLFGAALLFGLPAYLLALASFFVQAIPFGLLGTSGGAAGLLFALLLLLLELTAYFLVVAGGGMLLATVIRRGFAGFAEGVNKLALMLPLALLLLLIGAWYEAAVIIVARALGG